MNTVKKQFSLNRAASKKQFPISNTRAQRAYQQLGMNESHYKFFEIDFVLK